MLDQRLADTTSRAKRMNGLLEQFQAVDDRFNAGLETASRRVEDRLGRDSAAPQSTPLRSPAAGSAASKDTAQRVSAAAHAGEELAQTNRGSRCECCPILRARRESR